jgi:hypothetical protein
MILNYGKKTLLWEDSWVNNIPFAIQFSRIFNPACRKALTVHDVKNDGCGLIRFRD